MNYAPINRVWSVAALTTPCVTLDAMRLHLRMTDTTEDALIRSLIYAAQANVEKNTQRLLTRRAVTLRLPSLPSGSCPIELPGGEVASITTFTTDSAPVSGVTVFGDSPALAIPADEWPAVTGTVYPVQIVYVAGFASCPEDLQAAVKLIVAELFERRSEADTGSLSEVPVSARYLMQPWRIRPI